MLFPLGNSENPALSPQRHSSGVNVIPTRNHKMTLQHLTTRASFLLPDRQKGATAHPRTKDQEQRHEAPQTLPPHIA